MVTRPALLFAFGAVALWSTNALVGKSALAGHDVSVVQFAQFFGAALVFGVMRFSAGDHRTLLGAGGPMPLLVGIVGLVGTMMLQYIAFASMPVIEGNLIAYTWPLMVAAAAILIGGSGRRLQLAVVAIIGFVGVALVIVGGRQTSLFQGDSVGYFAAFGSALCMAFYTLMVGRYPVRPDRLLFPSACVGVAIALGWAFTRGAAWTPDYSLVQAFYLGIGPMGLGYYFWSRALNVDASGKVAILAYLTPILSTALLASSGETLTPAALFGAVLVIGSCLTVALQPLTTDANA